MSAPAAIDALVDGFEAAWSGREPGAFHAVCAPDIHYEDPVCGEPIEGPDRLGAHAARLWAMFPDARVERTGPRLTDGGYLAAPCKVLGTHRGEVDELPPTGRFLVVQVVFFCQLDADGRRLWRVRAFFDAYDAAVQIGVLPARGTLSERALLMLRGFGLRSRT